MKPKAGKIRKCRAFVIAGTHSGAGKTTWALALMALLKRRGLEVQPFKAGPDYIDPGFHHQVCAPRRSRNLDLFLLSETHVARVFEENIRGADFAVIEGVMGLFDGRGPDGNEASTAHLAKILKLPVLLVLDGSGMASSAAAIVLGFRSFDPQIRIAGVLLNKVNSEGHYQWLKKAIEKRTRIPCLGFLPKDPDLEIPERHLGLVTACEIENVGRKARKAAELLGERFNWPKFMRLSSGRTLKAGRPRSKRRFRGPRARIGVARDAAFSFYYEDNLDLLREAGAEIVFFSPLRDSKLPHDLGLLYLGGGFPEVYASELAGNEEMLQNIRQFHARGGRVYAECGGLMYLAEAFLDSRGKTHPFAGLIPGQIRMEARLQHFGYHEIVTAGKTFLFPKGFKLRSHEFHYSSWSHEGIAPPLYRIGKRAEGYAAPGILASYQHLHFGACPEIAAGMVRAALKAVRVYRTQTKNKTEVLYA